jgi:hypothetical protein
MPMGASSGAIVGYAGATNADRALLPIGGRRVHSGSATKEGKSQPEVTTGLMFVGGGSPPGRLIENFLEVLRCPTALETSKWASINNH